MKRSVSLSEFFEIKNECQEMHVDQSGPYSVLRGSLILAVVAGVPG